MKIRSVAVPAVLIKKILIFSMTVFLVEILFSSLLPVTGFQVERDLSFSGSAFLPSPFPSNLSKSNGSPGQIIRLFMRDRFSYSVVDQPRGNPGYVSSEPDTLTRFRLAGDYGAIGLLAHNYLAGASYFDLKIGDTINLLDVDGSNLPYLVIATHQFQATIPTSAYSNFIDLEDGKTYTASELFLAIYGQNDLLILQTCIENDGIESWGRYFVIAVPLQTYLQEVWYGI